MRKTILAVAGALLLSGSVADAKVKTESVEYKQGAAVLEGLWAWHDGPDSPRPKAEGGGPGAKPLETTRRPAVIIVHEWKGPGEYTKQRAQQLASMGYVAFAADIYGKGLRPKDHEEAGKAAGMFRGDRNLMRARIQAALDLVKADKRVDPTKIAAIGYCFGGTTVLELARSGADVDLVASFHGALDTPMPAEAGKVKARVIAFQGGDDKGTLPGVAGFEDEMRTAGADWMLVSFGGAVHSFTVKDAGNDPSKGMAYDEKADLRSWEMLSDALKHAFQ